jgi:thioredoxin-like negative regulator of GroEL
MLEGFEKLKTLESKEHTKLFVEKLKKNNITPKGKALGENGPFEIWVPYDKMFTALGLSAEFDAYIRDLKPAKEYKNSALVEKAIKLMRISFGALFVALFVFIGYQLIVSFKGVDLDKVKVVSIKIDLNDFDITKFDYSSLFEQCRNIHSDNSKLKLNYYLFKWNMSKAMKAYNSNDLKTAAVRLEKCLRTNPENSAITSLLLKIYLESNIYDKAKMLLKDSINLVKDNFEWKKWLVLQLSAIYLNEQNYFGAEYELNAILVQHPDDSQILRMLAKIHNKAGNNRKAIEILNNILKANTNDYEAHILLGNILYKEMQFDAAEKSLSTAYDNLDAHDELGEISLRLANIYINLEKINLAKAYINQAELMDMETPEKHLIKSVFYYIGKYFESSKGNLSKIPESSPEYITAGLYLNLITLHEGGIKEAGNFISKTEAECKSNVELSLLYYNKAALALKKNMYGSSWKALKAAHSYDKYLLKRLKNDPLLNKLRKSGKYSVLLKKLTR